MEATVENKAFKLSVGKCMPYVPSAMVAVLAVYLLKDYFIPGIQIALGILVAPFVFKIKQKALSYRYAIISCVFLLAYYVLHSYVLLFFSVGCLLFFTIESRFGKIGIVPFLFLVCISPALHYLVNTFTFSIRLELSRYSAIILNSVGMEVENKGSFFIMPGGDSFSVDTACIGLNMFNTGLTLALLLVGFSEHKTKRSLGSIPLLLIFLLTAFCLVLTNLLRIVALVFFKSAPGTLHHDLIGMLSLIAYTVIPVYFFIRFLNTKYGKPVSIESVELKPRFLKSAVITISLSVALIAMSSHIKTYLKQTIKDQKLSSLVLPGYNKQLKEDGVFEFSKDSVLIYIKPASRGYESDHPPAMCWQGSGFTLETISEVECSTFKILTAVLKRDSVIQYTAWWYDNGTHKTISQWDWRFSKGEPYRIINITTKTKKELDELCHYYLKQKLF